jgi:SdrD B-like domain/Putative peptidoglycan binding domain
LIAAGVRVVGGVDGIFKIGDWYAVQTFQRHNGLPVTGVIDMATAVRLGSIGPAATATATASVLATAAVEPVTSAPATTAATTTTTTPTSTTTSTTTTTVAPATAAPAGEISGTVWTDDGDGVREPDEPALPGVAVRLLDSEGTPATSDVSDAAGAFAFGGLTPGSYSLEINVPAEHAVTTTDHVPPGVDPALADDTDSDLAIVDLDSGTARTAAIEVTDEPVDDLGLGLVPVPSEAPASSSSVEAPTTTAAPTTTVAAEPTTATTTLPATTTTVAAPTTTAPAPPTEPSTTAASQASTQPP